MYIHIGLDSDYCMTAKCCI